MIAMQIKIDAGGLFKRLDVKAAATKAMTVIAKDWAEKSLPLHFKPGNAQRYFYRQRSAKYLRRKRRMASYGKVEDSGGTDLVFSGRMRQWANAYHTVTTQPGAATVHVAAPSYVRYRGMAREVTQLTVSEESRLGFMAEKIVVQQLNKPSLGG